MAQRAKLTCLACQGYVLLPMDDSGNFKSDLDFYMNYGCPWDSCQVRWQKKAEQEAPTVALALHILDTERPMLKRYDGGQLAGQVP